MGMRKYSTASARAFFASLNAFNMSSVQTKGLRLLALPDNVEKEVVSFWLLTE